MNEITSTNPEHLWKQYEILVGLHKYYFELILSGSAFVNGIIAAITIYVLKKENEHFAWVICFPAGLAAAFSIILFTAIPMAMELREALGNIVTKLGVGLAPHSQLLINALWVFAIQYLFVVAILLTLALSKTSRRRAKSTHG